MEGFCVLLLFAVLSATLARNRIHSLPKEELLHGDDDVWFESLSEDDLRDHWSGDDGLGLHEKIDQLKFSVGVFVDVKLVGFNQNPFVKPDTILQRYLEIFNPAGGGEAVTRILRTQGGSDQVPLVKTRYVYRVSMAKDSLVPKLASAIHSYAEKHHSKHVTAASTADTDDLTVKINPAVVDDIIAQEYEQNGLSYTLYILNLPALKLGTPTGPRSEYLYFMPTLDRSYTGTFTATEPRPVCGSSLWVGKQTYAWIDLTAGPNDFGPETSGDGAVTEHTLPRVEGLLAHAKTSKVSKSSPRTSAKDKDLHSKTHAFFSELGAVLHRSVNLLITPPAYYFPIPYTAHVVVTLIVIRDYPAADAKVQSAWEQLTHRFQPFALAGQSVSVETHFLSFEDCDLCVAAFSHALRTHPAGDVLKDGLKTSVSQYLDASDLHEWLGRFDLRVWRLNAAAAEGRGAKGSTVRSVTAFVYDLQTEELLLLDKSSQAVSFPDMVVGVQTRAAAAELDFSCDQRSMALDPADATRAVTAGLLQSVWGVAPTHTYWTPPPRGAGAGAGAGAGEGNNGSSSGTANAAAAAATTAATDWLWSSGLTPFGPFSHSSEFSFVQTNAAFRTVLLSEVARVHGHLAALNSDLRAFGHEVEEVFSDSEHLLYLRRWNIFSFKLGKARHYLSLNNFNEALYYVRSCQHDVAAMGKIVKAAQSRMVLGLDCGQGSARTHWFGWWMLELFVLLLAVAAVMEFMFNPDNPVVAAVRKRFVKDKRF